jgi:hypothetical protein
MRCAHLALVSAATRNGQEQEREQEEEVVTTHIFVTNRAEVILDDHNIPHIKVGVQTPGRVRDDEQFHAHKTHNADREHGLLHCVALRERELVVVDFVK